MTVWQGIILGFIQGVTEFLPISSSGHLVIIPFFLGWQLPEKEMFIFNVLVQAATLFAVIAFFWLDILVILRGFFHGILVKKPWGTPSSRLGWYLILATIPAGIVGLIAKKYVEQIFNTPLGVGLFLIGTAGLLVFAERLNNTKRKLEELSWLDALWMGLFQTIAIFPGISRSGATITGGMLRGLDRPSAARFSFLMALPVMLAAGILEMIDLSTMSNSMQLLWVFLPGFIVAAIVGYLSIRWLLNFLITRSLYIFSVYCFIVGIITIGYYFLT